MTNTDTATGMLRFDNTYARDLDGFYVEWKAEQVPKPRLISWNRQLAERLGIDRSEVADQELAEFFSGNRQLPGAHPLSQAYAGHQFGGFSPQLGDGRALLLGEVLDRDGNRLDIQLKGSGHTPFSRGGDGKAALGPVLREYLIAEAMHALGIPTSRALAAVTTGEYVMREQPLPGAILTRVASSHIRVGTFQFFAVRKDVEKVKQLADYAIARHYPGVANAERPYLALFEAVAEAQASLLSKWMLAGFVHGVMNTDNMTIAGETIDYGPCAFLDSYDPDAVFSSIDTGGRYAYGKQPLMAQWNLARFAETLIPIVDEVPEEAVRLLTEKLDAFPSSYLRHWLSGMRAKLGLASEEDEDLGLANGLYASMNGQNVDFVLLFRRLSDVARGDAEPARALFDDPAAFDAWVERYRHRCEADGIDNETRAQHMDRANPIYIPRNHKVEEALAAAVNKEDHAPFEKLLAVITQPYDETPGNAEFAQPAPPEFGPYQTFCGT